jgi:hypothetical protein
VFPCDIAIAGTIIAVATITHTLCILSLIVSPPDAGLRAVGPMNHHSLISQAEMERTDKTASYLAKNRG